LRDPISVRGTLSSKSPPNGGNLVAKQFIEQFRAVIGLSNEVPRAAMVEESCHHFLLHLTCSSRVIWLKPRCLFPWSFKVPQLQMKHPFNVAGTFDHDMDAILLSLTS